MIGKSKSSQRSTIYRSRRDYRNPRKSAKTISASRRNFDDQPKLRKHAPDYSIILIILLLLSIGTVVGYTNSPGLTQVQGLPGDFYIKKQLIAIVIGVFAFIFAAVAKLDFWRKMINPLLGLALFSSLAVRLFGDPIYGAYRWLSVGGVSVQTVEIVKLAIVLWLAYFVYQHRKAGDLFEIDSLKIVALISGLVVGIVAILQSDFGSALVILGMIFGILFIAGLPIKYILLSGAGLVLILALSILPFEYRRQRLDTFLNPTADCQDSGYQVCQALITVGSGGVLGRGLGRSVQAYGYLPEALSDSVFATIAENLGFMGAAIVVLLFLELFRRLYRVAIASVNPYHRYLVFGILMWLGTQTIINVGAMVGLLPLKGITLPLVSFGGTSVIFVLLSLGIVFNISSYTDLRAAHFSNNRTNFKNSSSKKYQKR